MAADKPVSKVRAVRSHLGEVIVQMQHMQSAVAVAVAALRRQNADLDEDIASLLQRSVSDKLQDQIEKIDAALRLLPPNRSLR
jgi:hypothetical protein